MTSAADAARESARATDGRFGTQKRAEAVVDLDEGTPPVDSDLVHADRASLLADPEIRNLPTEITDLLSDDRLRVGITEMRARRADFEANLLTQSEREEAERSRRASYRRPEWLRMDNIHGQRQYRTAEGYYGRAVTDGADGRARTSYLITSPDNEREAMVDRVESMVQWIENDRAERAKSWTGTVPLDSAAARHERFSHLSPDNWYVGPYGYTRVTPDGSYVSVHATPEKPDTWSIDGEFADGTYFDGGWSDSYQTSRVMAEEVLAAGKDSYLAESGS